eukprot:Blabericola_migrator_1__8252@NODE_427_length_8589_cov_62_998123_g337_i0_p1_GENE_NODE_427_length_8589_cov_62_998123_g337_i0NODE_427_length_8589_cov_62_998123_g337_i0_p1_ORF_typecomplete_len777_score96_93FeADH/PF00465_19/0_37_NODE_427_length_8589_cov_62_998123_g337_i042026532
MFLDQVQSEFVCVFVCTNEKGIGDAALKNIEAPMSSHARQRSRSWAWWMKLGTSNDQSSRGNMTQDPASERRRPEIPLLPLDKIAGCLETLEPFHEPADGLFSSSQSSSSGVDVLSISSSCVSPCKTPPPEIPYFGPEASTNIDETTPSWRPTHTNGGDSQLTRHSCIYYFPSNPIGTTPVALTSRETASTFNTEAFPLSSFNYPRCVTVNGGWSEGQVSPSMSIDCWTTSSATSSASSLRSSYRRVLTGELSYVPRKNWAGPGDSLFGESNQSVSFNVTATFSAIVTERSVKGSDDGSPLLQSTKMMDTCGTNQEEHASFYSLISEKSGRSLRPYTPQDRVHTSGGFFTARDARGNEEEGATEFSTLLPRSESAIPVISIPPIPHFGTDCFQPLDRATLSMFASSVPPEDNSEIPFECVPSNLSTAAECTDASPLRKKLHHVAPQAISAMMVTVPSKDLPPRLTKATYVDMKPTGHTSWRSPEGQSGRRRKKLRQFKRRIDRRKRAREIAKQKLVSDSEDLDTGGILECCERFSATWDLAPRSPLHFGSRMSNSIKRMRDRRRRRRRHPDSALKTLLAKRRRLKKVAAESNGLRTPDEGKRWSRNIKPLYRRLIRHRHSDADDVITTTTSNWIEARRRLQETSEMKKRRPNKVTMVGDVVEVFNSGHCLDGESSISSIDSGQWSSICRHLDEEYEEVSRPESMMSSNYRSTFNQEETPTDEVLVTDTAKADSHADESVRCFKLRHLFKLIRLKRKRARWGNPSSNSTVASTIIFN